MATDKTIVDVRVISPLKVSLNMLTVAPVTRLFINVVWATHGKGTNFGHAPNALITE